MKIKIQFIIGLVFGILFATGLILWKPVNAAGADERQLKEACLQAAVRAIGMEIKNYEQKLDAAQNGPGNSSNIPEFKKRIAELEAELGKYRTMDPGSYNLPEKKTVTVSVNKPYQEGTILEVDNMTKSGPFYHLAGLPGGEYSALKTGRKYIMDIYLVYKRDYVLPFAASHYVYISNYTTPYSLSPRQIGEEILEELIVKPNNVTVRVSSNGGTDKNSFRVDIQKEDGISGRAPHYVLTFYRVVPDECKAIVEEGALITFDLKKDLGLSGIYTFSVKNKVFSTSQN